LSLVCLISFAISLLRSERACPGFHDIGAPCLLWRRQGAKRRSQSRNPRSSAYGYSGPRLSGLLPRRGMNRLLASVPTRSGSRRVARVPWRKVALGRRPATAVLLPVNLASADASVSLGKAIQPSFILEGLDRRGRQQLVVAVDFDLRLRAPSSGARDDQPCQVRRYEARQ
jgi:hypothetical protein